ncbi:MAG: 50S ribosomal protein L24 [Candidatus Omnitrophota bacterium]
MKIKKNDQVMVIAGKDRGKKGRVLKVYPKEQSLLVEKVNYHTIYLRRSQQNPQGGIAKAEGKIHISNVKLLCPRTNQPTRVGYSILKDGTKQRFAKKSGEVF